MLAILTFLYRSSVRPVWNAALAHRVVWLNPHRGKPGYLPVQAGIVAVLPYLDDLIAGHSLNSFADLLEVVADA